MIFFLDTIKETGINWTAISAIGTILAALSSWIAIYFAYKTNKKSIDIAHAQVKPNFMVQSVFEKRLDKCAEIKVINKGYKDIKGILNVYWVGDLGVEVESNGILGPLTKDDIGIMINVIYKNTIEPDTYRGYIFLEYTDILGKKYKEKLDVEITYHYYEEIEEYSPLLNHLIRPFE